MTKENSVHKLEFEKFQFVIMKFFIIEKRKWQDTSGKGKVPKKVRVSTNSALMGDFRGILLMYLENNGVSGVKPLTIFLMEIDKQGASLNKIRWKNCHPEFISGTVILNLFQELICLSSTHNG